MASTSPPSDRLPGRRLSRELPPSEAPPGEGLAGGSPAAERNRSRLVYATLGAAAVLVGWQLLSMFVNPAIMASPADTFAALAVLAWEGTLWTQLLITLMRLVLGLAIGALGGLVLGILAGLEPRVRSFLEPLRWTGMTVPAVIIAVLAMLWFGLGDVSVVFLVAAIVIPTMYVNTVAGVLAVDRRLVEMGRVYRFSGRLLLSEIYLPGIGSPVMAGLTLAAGIAVRAVVLGEVLGAMDGIGHAFSRAMSYLETPELFAWVLVLLALMGALELGLLRPLKRRATRLRKVD